MCWHAAPGVPSPLKSNYNVWLCHCTVRNTGATTWLHKILPLETKGCAKNGRIGPTMDWICRQKSKAWAGSGWLWTLTLDPWTNLGTHPHKSWLGHGPATHLQVMNINPSVFSGTASAVPGPPLTPCRWDLPSSCKASALSEIYAACWLLQQHSSMASSLNGNDHKPSNMQPQRPSATATVLSVLSSAVNWKPLGMEDNPLIMQHVRIMKILPANSEGCWLLFLSFFWSFFCHLVFAFFVIPVLWCHVLPCFRHFFVIC